MQPRMGIATDAHVGNIYSCMTLCDLLRKAVGSTIGVYGQRESCWCRRGFTSSVHSEPLCKRQDYFTFYCGSTTTA